MDELTEEKCIESVAFAIRRAEEMRAEQEDKTRSVFFEFLIAENHYGPTSAYGRIGAGESGPYGLDCDNRCGCCGAMPQAFSVDVDRPVEVAWGSPYSDNVVDAGREIFKRLNAGKPDCGCIEWILGRG